MQYTELIDTLARYCQQEQADASFTAATPRMIGNAELRCYRALDLVATSGQNYSLQTVALSQVVDLLAMSGQTVNDGTPLFRVYPTVVQAVAAKVGNRWIPYQACSLDWLNLVWPDLTLAAPPALGLAYYTVLDDRTLLIAPVPDLVYPLRIAGQWRPLGMSAANPTTWLGDNIPDLLFAALMVEAMGYQRDFGTGAEDPQAAVSWEARFNDCLRSAKVEEFLRKGQGPDFQAFAPAPLAHPPPQQGA